MVEAGGIKFAQLSSEQKESLFSTAVQHGGGGAKKAVDYAFSPKLNDPDKDRWGARLDDYNKLEAEGKKLATQKAGLEAEGRKLLEQKVQLLERGRGAQAANLQPELERVQRQIDALQVRINAQDTKIQANNKASQIEQDWLIKNAKKGADNPEQFIRDVYDWRIRSNPSEAKSRYIPERDMLLKQLKDRKVAP